MSAVKSPVMFWCSMALALVVLGFVADRTLFLLRAVHTTGNVVELRGANGSCSCGRHCSYSCTKFQAQVSFQAGQEPATVWVSAGSAHGYDCPVTQARYTIEDSVPVIFNPHHPAEAYRDTVSDVWGTPLMVLFFQIVTLVSSFTKRTLHS
ncbi:MAG TPA: hypothetical protein VGV09_06950 [Steroidobacteraceae bacterium]|nr:hypothetical protein [Steroidobacteraceae bacterium]